MVPGNISPVPCGNQIQLVLPWHLLLHTSLTSNGHGETQHHLHSQWHEPRQEHHLGISFCGFCSWLLRVIRAFLSRVLVSGWQCRPSCTLNVAVFVTSVLTLWLTMKVFLSTFLVRTFLGLRPGSKRTRLLMFGCCWLCGPP